MRTIVPALLLVLGAACASDPAPEAAPVAEAAPAPVTDGSPCPEGELWFHCPVNGGKAITVCGASTWMEYRFGPPHAPELVFPADRSPARFTHEERRHIRSEGDALVFENGGYRYEVTEMSGGGGGDDAASNNFVGVYVSQGDELVATVGCTGEGHSRWEEIRRVAGGQHHE